MPKKSLLGLLGLFLLVFISMVVITPVQSQSQPRTIHNACMGSCVADVNFLHSGMGDRMAKNAFHGWFDSYYTLTGCGDPAWKTDLLFLLDVVGDMVGAPGAPTMQCWQGLAAQASLCSDTCSEYFIPDARYAPNVQLDLDSGVPGALEVTLDNQTNLNSLPELQPNAYSRRFHLITTLQLNEGTAVPVNDTEMPSLSFPNWITRGGYSDCINAYGDVDDRCKLIENFTTPSILSTSVEFKDGVFYDLTDQVTSLSDADGSFSQDGFIRLLSDGDQITIKQGAFSGYAWVKTHNRSTGAHTTQVISWDAAGQNVTIVNHECTSWLSTCWITGDRTETDTYLYAVSGPAEHIISGNYTVQVVADIPHEKDFTDNSVVYSYDSSAVGVQEDESGDDGPQDPGVDLQSLPIIDLPGPGSYPNLIAEGTPAVLYRLNVPSDIRFMFMRLVALDAGRFNFFVRRGSIPVPNYPTINNDYDCWEQSDDAYSGGCPFTAPPADAYYILVFPMQGGNARLEIEWTTTADSATQIARQTQEAEMDDTQEGQNQTYTEIEANNTLSTANAWDMQEPFTGRLARSSDRDVVLLNFTLPGIYSFTLDEVGADLRVKMTLVRSSSGNYLDAARAPAKGQNTTLTFDASAGEAYYLIISALASTSNLPDQPYRLSLTGYIPDPHEPNDDRATATAWDLSQGALQGYLWDKTTGRVDYFVFTAPPTAQNAPIVFEVTNPSPNARLRLTLMGSNGVFLQNCPFSAPGQPASLSKTLEAGKQFYLELETLETRTSLLPYTLSAAYPPGEIEPGNSQDSLPVRLHGLVFRPGSLLPIPIRDANIYGQPAGQPAVLLDATDRLGTYSASIQLRLGQEVRIWAEKDGYTFSPDEENWTMGERARSHRSVFRAVGVVILQVTPTPDLQASPTPLPPRMTAIPPTLASFTSTPTPRQTATVTTITGHIWRLFPDSPPAGVGAASLILSINGAEQSPVMSTIDGMFIINVPGLQAGDQLTLRAENAEDEFEPLLYQWQTEAGVDLWSYDFYSYWGEIPATAQLDQNVLYGRVIDRQGQGVPGVTLVLQVGTSDALVRIGPTDANGRFKATVHLPDRIMAAVWVEQPGFVPSRRQFFHTYNPENRELNFQLP